MRPIFYRLFTLLALLTFSLISAAQGLSVSGTVVDAGSTSPLPGAVVQLGGGRYQATSGSEGQFTIRQVQGGNYQLSIMAAGYDEYTIEVTIADGTDTDLGTLPLSPSASQEQLDANLTFLTEAELMDDGPGGNIPGLLTASRDVYLGQVGFNLGSARFQVRGLDNAYTIVAMNNITMNDPDDDRTYWSAWGGLNDVTRQALTTSGLQPLDFSFGEVGGATNMTIRPTAFRQGMRFTLSSSNRSYALRGMATYTSKLLLKEKFAYTLSTSWRYADQGYIPGTYYEAYAFFGSAEFRLNSDHTLVLTTFTTPLTRGKSIASVQEIYDIMGTNFYNPYWGFQEGKVRNSRMLRTNRPTAMLTHLWRAGSNTRISTSAMYQGGHERNNALWWFDAPDPRPEYYRYLPSFYEQNGQPEAAEAARMAWQNDPSVSQINWTRLYEINRRQEDGRAQYLVEDRTVDINTVVLNTVVNSKPTERLFLDAGAEVRLARNHYYKTVSDLLGATYWKDVDRFAERDFPGEPGRAQADLNNPDRMVGVGDIFGYNYHGNIRQANAFAQGAYHAGIVRLTLAATGGYTTFWRTGNMRNGNHPNNSFGDSEKATFFTPGIRTGALVKLDGRNYLYANGALYHRAPNFNRSFISPRTRNDLVDGLTTEKVRSGELGYEYRSPYLKARITGYYTHFSDQLWVVSFYHDGKRNFVNFIMNGIETVHRGVEAAAEARVFSDFTLSGAVNLGQYFYNNRPQFTIIQDNIAQALSSGEVFIQNYRVAGSPQKAATAGLKYNGAKFWWAGVNVNYFADNYISLNPDRRTLEAVYNVDEGSPLWNDIIRQERLPNALTTDLYAGKSFKLKSNLFLVVSLNVTNVLNNTDFITGGFEQLRYDANGMETRPDQFPNRYFYFYGRTWFLNLVLRN